MSDPLRTLTIADFLDRLASRAPTPGGGSASALAGATAAALVGMVLELTAGRPEAPPSIEDDREAANRLRAELTELIDRDASAYDAFMAARRLPKETDAERVDRHAAMTEATREATRIPLRIAVRAGEVLALAERVAAYGARAAISDVGVAGELAAAAARGAALNVRINLPYLAADDPVAVEAAHALDPVLADVGRRETAIRDAVSGR